jgi:hypothetical protein
MARQRPPKLINLNPGVHLLWMHPVPDRVLLLLISSPAISRRGESRVQYRSLGLGAISMPKNGRNFPAPNGGFPVLSRNCFPENRRVCLARSIFPEARFDPVSARPYNRDVVAALQLLCDSFQLSEAIGIGHAKSWPWVEWMQDRTSGSRPTR